MSTLAAGAAPRGAASLGAAGGGRRPGYWLITRRVLLGQALGTVMLLAFAALLSSTSLITIDMSSLSIYEPWIIDGPWSLLAALGWGLLVVTVVGSLVRAEVTRRTGVRLSRTLTLAAVALGGYAPTLLEETRGARVVLTVLATAALVRALAFAPDGSARVLPSRAEPTRRSLAALFLATTVAVVIPFAILHPLLSLGSIDNGAFSSAANPSDAPALANLSPGGHLGFQTALKPEHFAITITAIQLVGAGGALRTDHRYLNVNSPYVGPPFGPPALALPLHVAPAQAFWIDYRLTLTRCTRRPLELSAVRISYRELGLSLEQTVPLDQRLTIAPC
jgi:hypothetical protein